MVELISEEMGMSRASLYRKIKALTGKSINEYIRDIKLDKSLYLIEKEGLNVSMAAFEVGFNNMKYFRKIKFLSNGCSFNENSTFFDFSVAKLQFFLRKTEGSEIRKKTDLANTIPHNIT